MLVHGCISDVYQEILGKAAHNKTIPSSTVRRHDSTRQIHDLAEYQEDQLITQIKSSKHYSLQLDEGTDITGMAILMVFVHFEYKGDLKKGCFFSALLPTN